MAGVESPLFTASPAWAVNPHSAAVIRRKFLLLAPLRAGVDPLLEVLSVRLGTAVQLVVTVEDLRRIAILDRVADRDMVLARLISFHLP